MAGMPLQMNGVDCGVFVCMVICLIHRCILNGAARFIVQQEMLSFSQVLRTQHL